jgi:hypothetical protein
MSHPNIMFDILAVDDDHEYERLQVQFPVPAEGNDMTVWWLMTAAKDLLEQMPKMHEYGGAGGGSADLRLMGDNLAELLGWQDAPDATRQELAVWFYVQGKAARLVSDYQQRRPGKPDTWHDVTVYSMMARRLQHTGRWP